MKVIVGLVIVFVLLLVVGGSNKPNEPAGTQSEFPTSTGPRPTPLPCQTIQDPQDQEACYEYFAEQQWEEDREWQARQDERYEGIDAEGSWCYSVAGCD